MSEDPIVIVAAKRTPMGAFQGALSTVSATDLGATAIKAVIQDANLKSDDVDEVFMGCVLPANLGQAPARQAVLKSGLDISVGATTVNKVCGSGLKSVMLAYDRIRTGDIDIAVAGGMESMTNAPYLLPNARGGYRMGSGEIVDHMMFDGLQDPYQNCLMGGFADKTAEKCQISREQQDEFAINSADKALKAIENGWFDNEITPVEVKKKKETIEIAVDEPPSKVMKEKIPKLRPAFSKEGTVTAANASSISDGAAAVVLMRKSEAEKRNLKILATIKGHMTHSQEPEWFTLAPIGAMEKLLARAGWNSDDVDLYEVNEAFAVVTMGAMQEMKLDTNKINVHGGAVALGHPIGASGARVLVTLIHALHQHDKKTGVASLCIGGGESVAMAIER